MDNIMKIYDLLDWKKSKEDNQLGIELAHKVNDVQLFIQPHSESYNKNIWENCAKILQEKKDSDIRPYLNELFEWLMDINWPGVLLIFNRLILFEDKKFFIKTYDACKRKAKKLNDDIWLVNLKELKREWLNSHLK